MKQCRDNLSLSACSDYFKEVEDKKISVLVPRPTKKKYVKVSPQQLAVLRPTFAQSRKCSASVRKELALNTGLTEEEVRGWYCHQRYKERQLPARKYGKVSPQQLEVLRSAFAQSPKCRLSLVRELTANTGLTGKQVRRWYTHQRQKEGLRLRANFNPEQVKEMVTVFNYTPRPDVFTTTHLSNRIGLSKVQIKKWFQNRRLSLRKRMEEEKEEEEEEEEEKKEEEDEDEEEEEE